MAGRDNAQRIVNIFDTAGSTLNVSQQGQLAAYEAQQLSINLEVEINKFKM
ncbi:MAG: methyl-accepting chemotaxis protein [Colwellia sp.]